MSKCYIQTELSLSSVLVYMYMYIYMHCVSAYQIHRSSSYTLSLKHQVVFCTHCIWSFMMLSLALYNVCVNLPVMISRIFVALSRQLMKITALGELCCYL